MRTAEDERDVTARSEKSDDDRRLIDRALQIAIRNQNALVKRNDVSLCVDPVTGLPAGRVFTREASIGDGSAARETDPSGA